MCSPGFWKGSALKMEAVCFSETLVVLNAEDDMYLHSRQTLKIPHQFETNWISVPG
jgi:hypothetical protein